MIEFTIWCALFIALLVAFLSILWATKDEKYFYFFVAGCILGFYFDLVSFTNGYYSYPHFYVMTFKGIPFSMTIAEGFSVAIVIYLSNLLKKLAVGISFFKS